ncbi:SURF1 family protein [Pseudorhodoplanes sp.]|uniref:SURF1 family protein n=1 Tax=Pseudorhodoplanes sp. TaxID=1934341 RepID=UPI002B9B6D73|nr:SURF1 family cytochrome oxidase biogenesis protein [Pseudorhodoplanes sp.]HWV52627.1 SURF1 family cytochrome oxidase biogenesis protein [Pseudorhodoplanes sp.]
MTAADRPYLRRIIVPGLLTIVSLVILTSLGVWQLHRKAWKEGLIATLDAQLAAAPVPLPPPSQWPALNRDNSEFRRVTLRGDAIADAKPVYLYTGASALRTDVKQAGYFVFAPVRLPGGQTVVVNRGYVPADRKTEPSTGPIEITGYLRWPESSGWFVPARDEKDDVWFLRDPAAMAHAHGWGPVAPFYIDQEAPVPPDRLPKPGPLTVKLKNDHLGYAITWFGLALSLVAVFLAWAIRERYSRTA